MTIGLFFGSFNPVHIGHLLIASYMVEFTDINQLWFVISPQNPLKKRKNLLEDYARLDLLRLALEEDERFGICDIEFRMPKPSYTIDTLTYLHELYPSREFVLIMGSDQLQTFSKWKNAMILETQYRRYIYPRPGFDVNPGAHKGITLINAPQIEISSTFIREGIRKGHDMRYYLPVKVYSHILRMHYYER